MTSVGRSSGVDRAAEANRQRDAGRVETTQPASKTESRNDSALARDRATDAFESGRSLTDPAGNPTRTAVRRDLAPGAGTGLSTDPASSGALRGNRRSALNLTGRVTNEANATFTDGRLATVGNKTNIESGPINAELSTERDVRTGDVRNDFAGTLTNDAGEFSANVGTLNGDVTSFGVAADTQRFDGAFSANVAPGEGITDANLTADVQFNDRLTGDADLNFGEGMRLDNGHVGLAFDGENTDASGRLNFADGELSTFDGSIDHVAGNTTLGLDVNHDFQTGDTAVNGDVAFDGENLDFNLGIDTLNGRVQSGELDAQFRFNDRLTGDADLNFGEGMRFDNGHAGLSFDGANTDVNGRLNFADGELSTIDADIEHVRGDATLGANVTHDVRTGTTDAGLRFNLDRDNFDLDASLDFNQLPGQGMRVSDGALSFSAERGNLTFGGGLNLGQDAALEDANLSLTFEEGNNRFGAAANFDSDFSLSSANFNGAMALGEHTSGTGELNLGANGRPMDMSLGLEHGDGPFSLSAGFNHNFETDRSGGHLNLDFNPNDDFSLSGRLNIDQGGDASVGLNASIRF